MLTFVVGVSNPAGKGRVSQEPHRAASKHALHSRWFHGDGSDNGELSPSLPSPQFPTGGPRKTTTGAHPCSICDQNMVSVASRQGDAYVENIKQGREPFYINQTGSRVIRLSGVDSSCTGYSVRRFGRRHSRLSVVASRSLQGGVDMFTAQTRVAVCQAYLTGIRGAGGPPSATHGGLNLGKLHVACVLAR